MKLNTYIFEIFFLHLLLQHEAFSHPVLDRNFSILPIRVLPGAQPPLCHPEGQTLPSANASDIYIQFLELMTTSAPFGSAGHGCGVACKNAAAIILCNDNEGWIWTPSILVGEMVAVLLKDCSVGDSNDLRMQTVSGKVYYSDNWYVIVREIEPDCTIFH